MPARFPSRVTAREAELGEIAVGVEHDIGGYPFASWTIHHRLKPATAIEAGAAASLITQPEPGGEEQWLASLPSALREKLVRAA